MVARDVLVAYLEELLSVKDFSDYCPNGLQIEGRDEISHLCGAVTASRAVVEESARRGADALLVHHGYFWKGEGVSIVGLKRDRIAAVLGAGMNLLAYHLPLDAHPELGNNAQWGAAMGWAVTDRFGDYELGYLGATPAPCSAAELAASLQHVLGRQPFWIAGDGRPIRRVAWCSGGAQGWFQAAIEAGADAFVTGEASEPCYHLARESGVAFYAAGHHATERFGVQALGRRLATHFGLHWSFIDEENPI